MKDDLLENLTRMAGEFEAAAESVRAARLEHIGARADLEALTTELLGLVKVVDGMIRYGFGDNPEIMAEWKAAKAVPAVRGKASPTPGVTAREQSDRSSPTPGGIAPAA